MHNMFVQYHENEPECLLIGTIGKVHYYDNMGSKNKRLARFGVAYGYETDDFGEVKNKYKNCIAWGNLADFANSLEPRTKVKIDGYLEENDYNGETREQIRCEFITVLQEPSESEQEKPKKKEKAQASDWEDTEIDF